MSVTDRSEAPIPEELDAFPEFELGYAFDDPDQPTEVTLYPATAGEEVVTNWITIDAAHAVALEDVR